MAVAQDIDLEALLVWAYRDERVDQIVQQTAAASRPGTPRAASWDSAGGGGGNADVSQDALTLHNLVMALKPSDSLIAANPGIPAGRLQAMLRGLVIYHAQVAGRPDWMPGARPKLGPVPDREGKPEKEMFPPSRRFGYCRVQVLVSEENIILARYIYSAWVWALAQLADQLRDKPEMLARWRVVRLSVPAEPWKGAEGGLTLRRKLDMVSQEYGKAAPAG